MGAYVRAETLARRSYEMAKRLFGNDYLETQLYRLALGDVLAHQGRIPEALAEVEPSATAIRRLLGDGSPQTLRLCSRLPLALGLGGHPDEAIRQARVAYEWFRRQPATARRQPQIWRSFSPMPGGPWRPNSSVARPWRTLPVYDGGMNMCSATFIGACGGVGCSEQDGRGGGGLARKPRHAGKTYRRCQRPAAAHSGCIGGALRTNRPAAASGSLAGTSSAGAGARWSSDAMTATRWWSDTTTAKRRG